MIGFLKIWINLIFLKEGDNMVFSPLHSEKDLNVLNYLLT